MDTYMRTTRTGGIDPLTIEDFLPEYDNWGMPKHAQLSKGRMVAIEC